MRIIYYYQTFDGLDNILSRPKCVTSINISSIHFGIDEWNNSYIHLNNNDPNDIIFDNVWKEVIIAQKLGIKILLMIGGAGGAYVNMFMNYRICYKLLVDIIIEHNIDGIDLDIEETVNIGDIVKLIKDLRNEFGPQFIITLAPLSESLKYDNIGMGGFCYKDLYDRVGNEINWFHVQAYYSYQILDYELMVQNGYPPNKLVFGMVSKQFNNETFPNAIDTVKQLKKKYQSFGGCFVWEYFDAPPSNNPSDWAIDMQNKTN